MDRFGDYARVQRENRRISLRSLAEALGLSAPYVSDIERGNRNPPDREKLTRWANLIGEEPEAFIRRGELDRRSVEIPVNFNPANTELALSFARKLPTMTDEERVQLRKFFDTIEDGKDDE